MGRGVRGAEPKPCGGVGGACLGSDALAVQCLGADPWWGQQVLNGVQVCVGLAGLPGVVPPSMAGTNEMEVEMKVQIITAEMLNESVEIRLRTRSMRTETGCLEWQGAKTPRGYGRIKVNGVLLYTHRVAYAFVHGGISVGGVVDHLCRNTSCLEQSHLELVSVAENTARGENLLASVARASIEGTACAAGHIRTPETWKLMFGSYRCLVCRKEANVKYRATESSKAYQAKWAREKRARLRAG